MDGRKHFWSHQFPSDFKINLRQRGANVPPAAAPQSHRQEARSSLHTNLPFRLIGLDLRANLDQEMSVNCKCNSHYSLGSFSNWPIGDFVLTGSVNTDPALDSLQTPQEEERNRFWKYFSFEARQEVKYHFHFLPGFQFQPPVRHFLVKRGPTSVATFFSFFFFALPKTFPSPSSPTPPAPTSGNCNFQSVPPSNCNRISAPSCRHMIDERLKGLLRLKAHLAHR